jgi:hypothetical protein
MAPVTRAANANVAPIGAALTATAWASLMRQMKPTPAATAISVYAIIPM